MRDVMARCVTSVMVLAALVLTLSGCICATTDLQCAASPSPTIRNVRFSISSRKNQTGHWHTQVQLLHGQDANDEATPWDVDVSQTTVVCGGHDMINISVTLASPLRQASPGYELFPDVGYYKFHATPDTWLSAKVVCSQEGGHLAIVNSQAEENVLKQLFARHTTVARATHNDFAFIGFHDRYVEGEYVTIFDKPLSSTDFVHWGAGQPDNAGGNPGEDCGSLHRSGVLNDITCDWRLAYICEQELW